MLTRTSSASDAGDQFTVSLLDTFIALRRPGLEMSTMVGCLLSLRRSSHRRGTANIKWIMFGHQTELLEEEAISAQLEGNSDH